MKYKRTPLTINGVKTNGYRVEGLDTRFRGLHVVVVKDFDRWHAYEATTGFSITPPSWAGGYSNKTRDGIIQIVANFLSNAPESSWEQVQAQLDYQLEVASPKTIPKGGTF